jgi:hypothetical protein
MKKKQRLVKKQAKDAVSHDKLAELLPPDVIISIMELINLGSKRFEALWDVDLTNEERRRMVGAGTKNYGFIDKVSDLAVSNPGYVKLVDAEKLKNCLRNIEACRDIVISLKSFSRKVSNAMIVFSDAAYVISLMFYNTVKMMSKHGDANAIGLFNSLRPFFKKHRRAKGKPTAKKLERNARALLKGTKEGVVVVENESPHEEGGERVVVDETRRSKG